MACGPNRVPGRCEVPPSNGAPIIAMSKPPPARASSVVLGTPAKVMSGPYMPGVISGSGMRPYSPHDGVNQTEPRRVEHVRLGASGTPGLSHSRGRPYPPGGRWHMAFLADSVWTGT